MTTKLKIFQDAKKEFRYSIIAANNRKLATPGEGYKTHSGVMAAVDRLKKIIPGAKIEDKTQSKKK